MTEDEYLFWHEIVRILNMVIELEGELDEEAMAEYESEYWPIVLEDELNARLDWLQKKKSVNNGGELQ